MEFYTIIQLITLILYTLTFLKTNILKFHKKDKVDIIEENEKTEKNEIIIETEMRLPILEKIIESIEYFVKLNKHKEEKSSICYELYKKKNENLQKLEFKIFIFTTINLTMSKFVNIKTINIISASLIILFALILTYKIILNYRFKNGYFGTNYLEAKELIYYIKNSKNNTHKGKKIFDESIKPSLLLNADDKTKIGEGV